MGDVGVPRTPEGAADFVKALDLHKAEIRRLRHLVCECGHRDELPSAMHDENCPAHPAYGAEWHSERGVFGDEGSFGLFEVEGG